VKSRAEKKKVIDLLSQSFSDLTSLVMVDYQGLKSGEMDELRKSLRDNNVDFYVVKNSLMKIASKDTGLDTISASFKGPMSIAISKDSPIDPAKWLFEFSKEHKALKILGGYLDGAILSKEEVKVLALLPDLDGMRSKLLSVLNGVASQFVRLVNAYKENQEGTGAAE
jgi:large subunit ribosomal protein L10